MVETKKENEVAKHWIKSIALALFALALMPAGAVNAQCLDPAGDVNLDGQSNIADLQCLALYSVYLAGNPSVPEQPACLAVPDAQADLNCDSDINVSDLVLGTRFAIGLEISPIIDADGSGCPDSCEVAGSAFVVPATINGSSTSTSYELKSLGAGIQSSGTATGGNFTLSPKAVGLTNN